MMDLKWEEDEDERWVARAEVFEAEVWYEPHDAMGWMWHVSYRIGSTCHIHAAHNHLTWEEAEATLMAWLESQDRTRWRRSYG